MNNMCIWATHSRRPDTEKVRFYDEMASERDLESSSEIIVSLGEFQWTCGKMC